MMKLTLTLVLGSAKVSNGFGVAKGSGGSEASQSVLEVRCGIAAKLESRSAEAHTWLSRAPSVTDAGPAKTRNSTLLADARQFADARATTRNENNLQTGITNFQLLEGNPHASQHFLYMVDNARLTFARRSAVVDQDENHCSIESKRAVPSTGQAYCRILDISEFGETETCTMNPSRSEPGGPPLMAICSSVAPASMRRRVGT